MGALIHMYAGLRWATSRSRSPAHGERIRRRGCSSSGTRMRPPRGAARELAGRAGTRTAWTRL